MKKRKQLYTIVGTTVGVIVTFVVFIIPFLFMLLEASKGKLEANQLRLSLPTEWHLIENIVTVIKNQDYQIVRAFYNSAIITTGSVALVVFICSMAGYYIQRNNDKMGRFTNNYLTIGLMVPPSIMPTIWIMQGLGLYKTMPGMILIETTLLIPFTVMLFRGYMANIPSELDEAALMDGCTPLTAFTKVIFPLLKPVTATAVILNSVTVYNDFMNPLYFLPGSKNATVQLTLSTYTTLYKTEYNLLFANVLLIVLPMLILFLALNEKIINGITAGSVKG